MYVAAYSQRSWTRDLVAADPLAAEGQNVWYDKQVWHWHYGLGIALHTINVYWDVRIMVQKRRDKAPYRI